MRVLDGYPMEFDVIGRKSGSSWYIGAATVKPRTIEIPLGDMITDNGIYRAYIFGDNATGSALEVTVLDGLTKDSVIRQDLLANGGCAIKLTKGTMNLTTPYSNYQFYEAEAATHSGSAVVTPGKYCSGKAYVGYVGGGNNNFVSFDKVYAETAGTYTLRIYYISGEPRNLKVDVNNAYAGTLNSLYANQNDWQGICAVNTEVTLKAGMNTIRLYNDTDFAPSIDRIAIAIPSETALLYGDLNFDGRLDARDLTLLKRGLLIGFTDAQSALAADFDRDGSVTSGDATALMRFLTTYTD